MSQPNIVYNDVKINNENVNDFISPDVPMVHGRFNRQTGVIDIFRYNVDGVSDKNLHTAALLRADYVASKEPITIAHETRHWYNLTNFGYPEKIAKTYYEFVSLIALDEISAYTAGFLYGDAKMHEVNEGKLGKVIIALHAGTSLYLSGLDAYLATYRKSLSVTILRGLQNSHISFDELRAVRKMADVPGNDLYSANFNSVIQSYMTFDGICAFREKSIPSHLQYLWSETKNNIQEIKKQCLSVVSKTLDDCLDVEHILFGVNQFKTMLDDIKGTPKVK